MCLRESAHNEGRQGRGESSLDFEFIYIHILYVRVSTCAYIIAHTHAQAHTAVFFGHIAQWTSALTINNTTCAQILKGTIVD